MGCGASIEHSVSYPSTFVSDVEEEESVVESLITPSADYWTYDASRGVVPMATPKTLRRCHTN